MTVKRRMAPANAATRVLLMDAVESLMRERGYAAVSARSIAGTDRPEISEIFYYFESMDDLLITTYRRRTQSVMERTGSGVELRLSIAFALERGLRSGRCGAFARIRGVVESQRADPHRDRCFRRANAAHRCR